MSNPLMTHLKKTPEAYRIAKIAATALGVPIYQFIALAIEAYARANTTIDYDRLTISTSDTDLDTDVENN